jgi:alcohol dehydrogenase
VGPQHFHHHAAGRHRTIPMLFKTVGSHKIDPKLLITHHFKLDKILDAYETFGNAAKTKALKVIIEA